MPGGGCAAYDCLWKGGTEMGVTRLQCERCIGHWVQFRTPWGVHRGIVEAVTPQAVLVRMPRQYAPVGLANFTGNEGQRAEGDLVLAQYWGYPGRGYPYAYPGAWWWWAGWFWWWLAFAWILALAFLW